MKYTKSNIVLEIAQYVLWMEEKSVSCKPGGTRSQFYPGDSRNAADINTESRSALD